MDKYDNELDSQEKLLRLELYAKKKKSEFQ